MTISATWFIPVKKIRQFNKVTNDYRIRVHGDAIRCPDFKDKLMVKISCTDHNWQEFNEAWQKILSPHRYGIKPPSLWQRFLEWIAA